MMRKKSKKTDSVEKKTNPIDITRKNTARGLLFLNAILWLGYVVYIYYDTAIVNKNLSSADMITIYVFVISITLFVSAILLGQVQKERYYFALAVVLVNTVLAMLSILDLFFFGIFVLDLFILFFLIPLRKLYLAKS
jgi:hypothetical protein